MRNSIPALRLPALFIGHGLANNALADNQFTHSWSCIGSGIGKPRGILVISAHWLTPGKVEVTAMEQPKTIMDEALPELEGFSYPAAGSSELAGRVRELLFLSNVDYSAEWGLDQGSWTVLNHLYPDADVPVVQLSLDVTKSPEWHYRQGEKLKALRSEGYLIIGSGNIVHNPVMADYDSEELGYLWAKKFQHTVAEAIRDADHGVLMHPETLSKETPLAIPSMEHYLPLLYVLASRDLQDDAVEFVTPECIYGSLSMMSVALWPSAKP